MLLSAAAVFIGSQLCGSCHSGIQLRLVTAVVFRSKRSNRFPVAAGTISRPLVLDLALLYGAAYDPGLNVIPGAAVQGAPALVDRNGGRPSRVNQWNISVQREVAERNLAGPVLFDESESRNRVVDAEAGAKSSEIEKALQMPGWPERIGTIDLGNRLIDAIPTPGHDTADLALYDRQTGLLLTGDTIYPGRLYVRNVPEYVKSIDRLVAFTKDKPVAHVLGTHIEQARTPFTDYKTGTVYQPDEAPLELSRGDLLEIQAALASMQGKPRTVQLSRMTIVVRTSIP